MNTVVKLCVFLLSVFYFANCEENSTPPHIVVILADDLGWNDVSFHGSNQIPTPNIDALAYNGIILNSHYVQPLCSPSRAAFLTGKYPIHLGMQHGVILEPEPRGLPLEEKLLPQYLKNIGYSTYAVGKWHLGFYRSEYTPTRRGFDYHYGYWNGLQDYYDHNVQATFAPKMLGYDMRRNFDIDFSAKGKYSTHLFTEEAARIIDGHNASTPMFMYMAHLAPHTGNMGKPFQAPDEEVAKFSYIADPERRTYAAMVSVLDQSVGKVVAALRSKGMLDNSIILFFSDNGAPTYGIHSNRGSNYPLRGQKESPWEGASRGVAAIWSPLFKTSNRVSNHLMHITDWLPTFWKAAGRDPNELGNIDGVDMWESLKDNKPSLRNELVLNIDELGPYVSVRHGEWKYVNGTTANGEFDHWFGETGAIAYSYDPSTIFSSPASVALSGFITERQIKEKNMNKTASFTMKLLEKDTIFSLRSEATINCDMDSENSTKIPCNPLEAPCLFNIKDDPCETINLAGVRPIIMNSMTDLVNKFKKTSIPPSNLPLDSDADPAHFGNVWAPWKDDVSLVRTITDTFSPSAIIALGVFFAILLLAILIGVFVIVRKSNWYKSVVRSRSFTISRTNRCPKHYINDKDKKKHGSRDSVITSPISVAQRVEMFEEREGSIH